MVCELVILSYQSDKKYTQYYWSYISRERLRVLPLMDVGTRADSVWKVRSRAIISSVVACPPRSVTSDLDKLTVR